MCCCACADKKSGFSCDGVERLNGYLSKIINLSKTFFFLQVVDVRRFLTLCINTLNGITCFTILYSVSFTILLLNLNLEFENIKFLAKLYQPTLNIIDKYYQIEGVLISYFC